LGVDTYSSPRPLLQNLRGLGPLHIERVERVAARHHAQARAGRAVAERAAERLAPQRRAPQHVSRQVGVGEHHAPQAHEVRHGVRHGVLRHVRQPLLQIAVGGSDEHQVRELLLQRSRRPNLPGHAAQRILGRQVAVERREHRGPLHVRVVVRAPAADADPSHAHPFEHRQQLDRVPHIRIITGGKSETVLDVPCIRIGLAGAIRPLPVRDRVEHGDPHPEQQAGHLRPDAVDDVPQKPRTVLETAAVLPAAAAGADQLVAQIPVARLDVDEPVTRSVRQPGRCHEIIDEGIELLVRQHAHAARHAPIQHRMAAGRQRLWTIVDVRPAPASGVSQLQADEEIAVGVRAEAFPMRGHQHVPQPSNRRLGDRRQHQLIGVRPAVVPNRDGFPTPHQLGAARTEVAPAPGRQLGRFAPGRAVPPLHGQHAEPVTHPHAVQLERLRERRFGRWLQHVVELQRDARAREVLAEESRGFQRCNPWVRLAHRIISPNPRAISARTSRRRFRAFGCVNPTPNVQLPTPKRTARTRWVSSFEPLALGVGSWELGVDVFHGLPTRRRPDTGAARATRA
jgi:hypothetical protein